MKKSLTYFLRVAFVIFVAAIALSPLFTKTAELDSLGLTPSGYLPVVMGEDIIPTPSATPTSTPGPSDLRFTLIEYNPPGNDVNGEFVEITNLGGMAQNIKTWAIVPTTFTRGDEDEKVLHDPFIFPDYNLQPGESVRVWTKIGINNAPDFYWNAVTQIWLNNGDTAILLDENGDIKDVCTYTGGGQNTTCD